jgi:hypothetical protein
MEADLDPAMRNARRAYELGRLRVAALRAPLTVAVVAAVAAVALGVRALVWLPVTLAVWVMLEWRGAFLLRGARRGVFAGFASLLVPLSVLRPCCGPDGAGSMACCTSAMPLACMSVGALLGLSLAVLAPRAPSGRRLEAAVGMVLGVASAAILRCAPLAFGEAVGMLGGMAAGAAAASLARGWLDRERAA